MNTTIWKFPLEITDNQSVRMPIGAEILSVQMQDGVPCLWALVDADAGRLRRHFEIFGTGHPIPCDMGVSRNFISTVQTASGLVFHVFEYTGG